MHDLVIRNGIVVDGTGALRRRADVAIDGAVITLVGVVGAKGRKEIDAAGLLVTPGWVDIHTHYDGQVSWDPYLSPSCWHGVTTAIMGNCGVGFAPVKPSLRDELINIMEGVEDIPGSALSEGLTWNWETFPEYLIELDKKPYVMDIGAQVPHAAVRTYVMGAQRSNEPANAAEIGEMSKLVLEGMNAGAFGFTTSRVSTHRAADGSIVPGTRVTIEEMEGIAEALGMAGHGAFGVVSDLLFDGDLDFDLLPEGLSAAEDINWMSEFSRKYGVKFYFTFQQHPGSPEQWQKTLALTEQARRSKADVWAQITMRPIGIIMGWQSSFHIFMGRPSYDRIAGLSFAEQLVELKKPAVQAAILSEKSYKNPFEGLGVSFAMMFRLKDTDGSLNYEPSWEDSVDAEARRQDRPAESIVYDMMMESEGNGYVFTVIINYSDAYNLDFLHDAFLDNSVILGGSDAGAHVGVICDAALPTFTLSYWARDRAGPRLTIEQIVERQTRGTASFYGLRDRGVLAPGMKADINIIDFDKLNISEPMMLSDLPTGARRLVQTATGYRATIVSGVVTFENGISTGELPGRLLRSSANVRSPAEAEV
ncbi:D-aminoacylase (plasmid) [Sphingomonas paeninsulae]|uniref:D-aminoacylase n=1 Tax=Sphingomonas paeninsulae TaxID=2319844 RepID=A0A494THK0_SPHPE|nr:amidohydrolase family protein [Sphingomonas paeninsulae]AYJ84908.1 D-aminoacylase [Sphingomonas paeninsulae]